jgi:hypothetical protein
MLAIYCFIIKATGLPDAKNFLGGLMKKSFIFGITMVLTLLLVFAGCSQSTSSSDDRDPVDTPPDGQVSLQNDLPAIAFAFSDPATKEVTVRSPLHLNDGELVIPRGKTLKFEDAFITGEGLTSNSKLIAGRDSKLVYSQGSKVDWTVRPKAKLIVTEAFQNTYIRLVDTEEENGKPITAKAEQIVYIYPFADFLAHAASPGSVPGFGSYGKILALESPGTIGAAEAEALAANTKGLKVYLVGDVTLASNIKLKNEGPGTVGAPALTESRGILANYNTDLDADGLNTLVVAGDVYLNGYSVEADGFTVWGTLKDDDTTAIGKDVTLGKTPLVAYAAKLSNPIFNGPVRLIAPLLNGFNFTVTFKDDVTIDGPIAFYEALFEGNATFNGYVTFTKPGATGIVFASREGANGVADAKTIKFKAGAEFYTDFKIDDSEGYDAGSVSFELYGKTPVKFVNGVLPTVFTFGELVKGVGAAKPGDDGIRGRIEISPDDGTKLDKYTDYQNVTVRTPVVIGTVATFTGSNVFEKDVTFGTNAAIHDFLTVEGNATFNESIGETTSVKFGTTGITINGSVVFGSSAVFNAPGFLNVGGKASFSTGEVDFGTASFNIAEIEFGTVGVKGVQFGTAANAYGGAGSAAVKTIGKATFKNGQYTGIGKNVTINGIVFASESGSGTASLMVPGTGSVVIDKDKLTVAGTVVSLLNAAVTLNSGKSIAPGGTAAELVFYEAETTPPTEPAGIKLSGVLTADGSFKVTGGAATLTSTSLIGLNNSVADVLLGQNTELFVPLEGTLSIGTASLVVYNNLNSRLVLGGTATAAKTYGSFSAVVLAENGSLSVNKFDAKKSAYNGWVVVGSRSSIQGLALVGQNAGGTFGFVEGSTYYNHDPSEGGYGGIANVITKGVSFATGGTRATATAGSTAAQGGGVADSTKLFFFDKKN